MVKKMVEISKKLGAINLLIVHSSFSGWWFGTEFYFSIDWG
jgi:hypothetical protein